MSPRVRRYLRELIAICGFVALAAVVGAYILDQQRLRWPWEDVTRIEATFSSAQAVTPGQGQTVNVAGVQVGAVGEVHLEDGRAVVEMVLDSEELGPVYRNATILLRPKTGLNDMMLSLDPGTPDRGLPGDGALEDGDRLPPSATLPNVNPDEVLANLDTDARRYLSIVANAGGQGLEGNGDELRDVLEASQPALERTARITRAIAARRTELRRLVHNLGELTEATAAKDDQLASLVDASAVVLDAIGGREDELAQAIDRLPGALGATRTALRDTRALAAEAQPALRELLPLADELEPGLVAARPLLRDATPIVRDDLRPLVREATPLLRELRPAVAGLDAAAPDLVTTGGDLNYVANELGFNPEGPEEGYLFWASWFFHNANNILSVEDAHGATWRGLVMVGCSSFGEELSQVPALAPLLDLPICPEEPDRIR
jgi:phospholipid/cholesterol/gamma-HCH transport system substrate-binding protein